MLARGCIALRSIIMWIEDIALNTLLLPLWEYRPPSNTRFLGHTLVHTPNGTSISSAVLYGSPMCSTDEHPDRLTNYTTSVTTVVSGAMQTNCRGTSYLHKASIATELKSPAMTGKQ